MIKDVSPKLVKFDSSFTLQTVWKHLTIYCLRRESRLSFVSEGTFKAALVAL